MRFTTAIVAAILQLAAAIANPTNVEKRASCTLTSFSDLASVKSSCTTITVGNLAVPAGQTLDFSGLISGTKIIFTGTVTFGYVEWEGPLVTVGGSKITITGSPGHLFNGNGASWWDGLGGNGGKIKVHTSTAANHV